MSLEDVRAQAQPLAQLHQEATGYAAVANALASVTAAARDAAATMTADRNALAPRSSRLQVALAQLAQLGASPRSTATPEKRTGLGESSSSRDPFTDPARGTIRGWRRVYALDGTTIVNRPDPATGAHGDPPSAREWERFALKARDAELALDRAVSSMGQRRATGIAGLGDAIADALAQADASQKSAATQIGATVESLDRAAAVTPDLWTNYAGGMLRGWFRDFSANGYGVIPAPNGPGTIGSPPSAAEWAAFDDQASKLGVGSFVVSLREHAKIGTGNANFFDQVNAGFQEFDRNVLRPAVAGAMTAEGYLDKYVPGWATIIDILGPVLPIVPIIGPALAALATLSQSAAAVAFASVAKLGNEVASLTGGNVAISVPAPLSSWTQKAISDAATYVARVGTTNLDAVENLQSTLGKAIATATTTRGDALAKFKAAGIEALQGAKLAASLAATVLTLGAASALLTPGAVGGTVVIDVTAAGEMTVSTAPAALASDMLSSLTLVSSSLSLLDATVNAAFKVSDALDAAARLKRLASASRNLANGKAAEMDREIAALEAQLADLKAQAAALARARLVQARTQTARPGTAGAPGDSTTELEELALLVALGWEVL